jgi:hypothetical protein
MISAPKCLQNQPPQFASLEHARARGAEKATTHPSSWPANGPAMSCPSSRTRTPDSGRLLLDLSFSVALMATPPLSVMGTWLRYGSSAQHLQPAADQGTQRRDPARSVSCWTKSSQHVVMIRKQKTAFVPNCHGYRYVNQSARGSRFYVCQGPRSTTSTYCAHNSPGSRTSTSYSFGEEDTQAQSNIVAPVYMSLDVQYKQDNSHTMLYPRQSSDSLLIYAVI